MSEITTPIPSRVEFDVVTVDLQGQERDRHTQTTKLLREPLGDTGYLELVEIPGGTFTIGAPKTEEGCALSQMPLRSVSVAPFWMGRYPVTQAQWQAVAALPKVNRVLQPEPANFKVADRPVEQVSWHAAVEFCDRLSRFAESRLSLHTGRTYRLPSEAEWEYACRAGTATPFHFGDTITTELANYSGIDWDYNGKLVNKGAYGAGPQGEDRRETTPVGYFQVANAFGLYDLHGNVREWCLDPWHDHYLNAPTDGSAWLTDGHPTKRVLRGGSWNVGPRNCRSAFRSQAEGDRGLYDIGFRVVCDWQDCDWKDVE